MTLDELVEVIQDYRARNAVQGVSNDPLDEGFRNGLDAGLEWCLLMLSKVDRNPPPQNWDLP